MKLYPLVLSNRLVTNIGRISKEIKMNVLIKEVNIRELDTLIVIGNGTPDDIAFSLIGHHLNGNKIVWIVKPERTRFGVIDLIPKYLEMGIRTILLLIDQEDDSVSTIHKEIKKIIKKLTKGESVVVEDESVERLKIYKGKYGSKEFELILVINGLDEIGKGKHSIEDHLLKVAEEISLGVGKVDNPKEAWSSIPEENQLKVFKELKARSDLVESAFPQQILGCRYLERNTQDS
jgi:hypothetical protein